MNRRLVVLLLLAVLAAASAQTTKKPAPPKIAGTPTLAAARTAVSKMVGTEALGIYLETYAMALPVHDAVTLCREFLPKVQAAQRPDLASLSGSIALIAGRCEDAAFLFQQGGGERPDLMLKAIRCHLAAGNIAEAAKQLDLVPDKVGERSYEAEKRLALSWLYLLEGEPEKAFILLQPLAAEAGGGSKSGGGASAGAVDSGGSPADSKREALFLLWIVASSPDFADFKVSTKGLNAASVEKRLAAEYPGSAELALVRKGLVPAPSAWLLSGLYAPQDGASGERSVDEPSSGSSPQGQAAGSGDSPVRLQVGWFSRKDNALALSAKLAKLGFEVAVDEQNTQDGQPRWAVIVDAGGDWSTTQAKLKDLGYESYLLP